MTLSGTHTRALVAPVASLPPLAPTLSPWSTVPNACSVAFGADGSVRSATLGAPLDRTDTSRGATGFALQAWLAGGGVRLALSIRAL